MLTGSLTPVKASYASGCETEKAEFLSSNFFFFFYKIPLQNRSQVLELLFICSSSLPFSDKYV